MALERIYAYYRRVTSVGLTEEGARSLKINVRAVDYEIDTLQGANLHTDEITLERLCAIIPNDE